jgi:predicted metal-dependent hydrolase
MQWNVVSTYKDKEEAAKLMHECNETLLILLKHLKDKYKIDKTADYIDKNPDLVKEIKMHETYNIVDYLLNNYNPERFYENDPQKTDETSYTMNKGDYTYFCIRDKTKLSLLDKQMIIFVMIHEAAHIGNYSAWGHGSKFWEVFKFLLHEAESNGIYTSKDYKQFPEMYCGLNVDYNPLYDESVKSIWKIN